MGQPDHDLVSEAELASLIKRKEVTVIDAYLHTLYDSKVTNQGDILAQKNQPDAVGVFCKNK